MFSIHTAERRWGVTGSAKLANELATALRRKGLTAFVVIS